MIPPCPRCLSTEHVELRPRHMPHCHACNLIFTGDPLEQAKYAAWRREQAKTQEDVA